MMKNNANGTVTIPMAEYKMLLRADILLDVMTNRAKSEKYFNRDDIKAMLGVAGEGGEDE